MVMMVDLNAMWVGENESPSFWLSALNELSESWYTNTLSEFSQELQHTTRKLKFAVPLDTFLQIT